MVAPLLVLAFIASMSWLALSRKPKLMPAEVHGQPGQKHGEPLHAGDPEPSMPPTEVLTEADRCDSGCGRHAKVRAYFSTGTVDLCLVHWGQMSEHVTQTALDVWVAQ